MATATQKLLSKSSSPGTPLVPSPLAGRQFRINKDTIALETVDGKLIAIPIPAGEIIEVVNDPGNYGAKVNVLWGDRVVTMFAADVEVRCMETALSSVRAANGQETKADLDRFQVRADV